MAEATDTPIVSDASPAADTAAKAISDRMAAQEQQLLAAFNAVEAEAAKARGEQFVPYMPGVSVDAPKAGAEDQPAGASVDAPQERGSKEADGEPGQGRETDTAYERAVQALRFAKFTSKDLEALSRERIIAIGTAFAENAEKVNAKLREDAEKKKQEEAASRAKTETKAEAKVQPVDDLRSKAKPILDFLGDTEAGEALVNLLGEVRAEAATQSKAEVEQLRGSLEKAFEVVVELRMERARERLPESIRKLADDATFQSKIAPKAMSFMQLQDGAGNRIYDFDSAVRDAALTVLGDPLAKKVESADAKRAEARKHGQFSDLGARQKQRPATLEDRMSAVFHAIESGASEADIRAAANGL